MNESVFKNILDCRKLERQSANETYKIAAKLHLVDTDGSVISFSRPNIKLHILKPALDNFGTIGGTSDTIHAETAVIMGAPITDNGDLYVTDPVCPNCMKNAIEAGIKRIFIDSAGFEKPWYQKRKDYFDHISLKLAEFAHLEIYTVDPDKREIKPLVQKSTTSDSAATQSEPVKLRKVPRNARMEDFIRNAKKQYAGKSFALGIGRNANGQKILIQACEAYTPGLDDNMTTDIREIQKHNFENKYSLKSDPVTRLMMSASRHGLSLRGSHLYCSHLPSARCQVNAVGYGIEDIQIDQGIDNAVNPDMETAAALNRHGILNFDFITENKDESDSLGKPKTA